MASRLFDRRTRERAWLLYAWCRHCDDECDGQTLGFATGSATRARIDRIRERTLAAAAGEIRGGVFDGLACMLRECPIPRRLIVDHLDGFSLDAEGWRPADQAGLLRYCYHVAGAVGCMMAVVMGVDPEDCETLHRASDLGIAFQLSNIARDVRDDHVMGRCYLPRDWMEELGVDPADPLDPGRRHALVALVRRITDLAAAYERSAAPGIAALPMRARWAVLSARGIYGGIGRKVASLGGAAWDRRVIVPRSRKLAIMTSSLARAVRPG